MEINNNSFHHLFLKSSSIGIEKYYYSRLIAFYKRMVTKFENEVNESTKKIYNKSTYENQFTIIQHIIYLQSYLKGKL